MSILCRLLRFVSWIYLTLLFGWLVAYLTTGDRFGYLGPVNLLAVYLFFPLPLVLISALLCRSRGLGASFLVGLLAFLGLWGHLFVPRTARVEASSPTLTTMTYNVLAFHTFTQPILDTIRVEDADVVFLQELNHNLASTLQTELAAEYPYQVHEPADNPTGIGVISKYPLAPTGDRLPHRWIGGPQFLTMDWNGQTIHLVNFHMYPTVSLQSQAAIRRDFLIREEQAQLLVEYARDKGPVVLGGDANSVPLSDAYHILTSELQDAWRQAGFGLGHTFPGISTVPGSDRPKIGSWYVPPWLARIDYIFFSAHWVAVEARLAQVDGVSDHRGVVAVLRLK